MVFTKLFPWDEYNHAVLMTNALLPRILRTACPEEIAYRMKLINAEQLQKIAYPMKKNGYGQYLLDLLSR